MPIFPLPIAGGLGAPVIQPSGGTADTIRNAALRQDTAPDGVATDATVTPVDPRSDAARQAALTNSLKAFLTPERLAQDASQVMDALVPAMQSLVLQRPDLATAAFDFQSDDGGIKVVSASMDAQDIAWLQDQLNANAPLVAAVGQFHDDAVEGYQRQAQVDGLPAADDDAVSAAADRQFGFMDIFKRFGQAQAHLENQSGTNYTDDGMKIDFSDSALVPDSALGLLGFAKGAQALAQGAVRHVESNGRTSYGDVKGSIFSGVADPGRIFPDFLPSGDHGTLGLSVHA